MERSRQGGDSELSLVLAGAVETIQSCMQERVSRYNSLAAEWSLEPMDTAILEKSGTPLSASVDWKAELSYDEWVRTLEKEERRRLHEWLREVARDIKENYQGPKK